MSDLIDQYKEELGGVIDYLKKEISSIRTGRANPQILDNVQVDAYGTKTPLNQVASISVPEARTIVVEPWDKNIIKDAEKAIREANIGVNPVNEGNIVRLTVPQLTEESRKELIKMLNEKLEQARIKLRSLRDRIKEGIQKAEKNNEITEDDRFKLLKELDETISDYNKKIEAIGEEKEKEIMTV